MSSGNIRIVLSQITHYRFMALFGARGSGNIRGHILFTIEQDKDENWMISKYTAPFSELLK